MAISKIIIGRETLPDGRILEYGARDPATGQRFERVLPVPAPTPTTPIVPITPTIPSTGPISLAPGELPPGAVRDPTTGKIYYPGGIKIPFTPTVPATDLRTQAINYLKGLGYSVPDEQEIQSAMKELGGVVPTKPSLEDIAKGVEEVQKKFNEMQERIKKEGITTAAGEVLMPPQEITTKVLETGEGGAEPPVVLEEQIQPKDSNQSIVNITTQGGEATSAIDLLIQLQAKVEKELEDVKAERKTWLEKLTTPPAKTLEERKKELYTEYGIPENIEKMKEQQIKVIGLQKQLDTLAVQRQADEDRAYARGMPMAYIGAEINEINRKYNSQRAYLAVELGAEAAVLQAYQGNIDEARSLVNDATQAWMWDYTEERNRYEFIFDYYKDWVNSLETDYKNILNNAFTLAVSKEELAREDANYNLELWTRAAEKGVYLDYADLLKMNREEATEIYAKKIAAIPKEVAAPTTREVGGVLYEWDKTTKTWKPAVGIAAPEAINVDYWVKAIESGMVGLSNVPDNIRNQVVKKLYAPREWTDEEFRIAIRKMKSEDRTYQEVLDEISMDDTIANEDRGRLIASEIYEMTTPKEEGILKTKTQEEIKASIIPLEGAMVGTEEWKKIFWEPLPKFEETEITPLFE